MSRPTRLPLAICLALIALATALLAAPPPAGAVLRSPHLTSGCESGKSYSEHVFGPWRVEGCNESVAPQTGESARRKFFGNIELNGMIVEGSSPMVVTSGPDGSEVLHKVHRENAKLVLDPRIGGSRRRFVIYSGTVDLEIRAAPPSVDNTAPGARPDATPIAGAAASQGGGAGTVDLPVSGVPALLGLRIRDQIQDATVTSGGAGADAGSMEFEPPMSLGATASALLKDWTGNVTIKTVDGTGMTVEKLKLRIPDIEIPGIGGFKDLVIKYRADDDEWSGTIFLDLGEPLFTLDLAMSVSASTGAPTRIAGTVDNLNIPIGNTGIFLQRVNASFAPNPMVMGVGAAATAGPEFGGLALIEISGQLDIELEPRFRLEADGNARVFPTGSSSQIATGRMHVLIDEDGYISIGGDARYELLVIDLGVSADIGGSGAYSTTSDLFNMEAHATGTLHLGFLGSFDVVHYEAVVSSDGWGTCGNVLLFVKAGIAQHWDRNPTLLLGCDLSAFTVNVARGARVAQAGERTKSFTVEPGTKTLGIEVTADQPGPRVALRAPNGSVRLVAKRDGREAVDQNAVYFSDAGSKVQYIALRNPAAGRWSVQWLAGDPQIVSVRTARDVPPLAVRATVTRRTGGRPGRRQVHVERTSPLGKGETLQLAVRTPKGLLPFVEQSALRSFDAGFDEVGSGARTIVAQVYRDGVPIPGRSAVVGRYVAKMPPPPASVRLRRRGKRTEVLARVARGAEAPDSWQYTFRVRGRKFVRRARVGKPVLITLPKRSRRVVTSVRPVVRGRVLRGPARTVTWINSPRDSSSGQST